MNLINNIKASYDELVNKVSWPTWPELMNSAVVVLIASVIIALIVAVMDISFENIMDFIYGLF
jgi:preprotein translocase subunit SecE